jgi:hypothetical protein
LSADNPDALGERPNVVAFLMAVVGALRAALRSRVSLVAENLALRQQLAILRRQTKRARLTPLDRALWIVLSRAWSRWAQSLAIAKPETVIRWHRRGFARFWAWKSKAPRPTADQAGDH